MNVLYYGDNLTVLRNEIKDESVDLVYLDPPFNSQATYNVLFAAPSGEKSKAQIEAFEDTWHWNESAESAFDEVMTSQNAAAAEMLRSMRAFLKENDVMAYLAMMAVRLLELHRVLKPTGSIYLHCDPTASHYLKILMDAIFGAENFGNEIIWKRTSAHSSTRGYGAVHDTILFYSKTDSFKWNDQYGPYDEQYVEAFFTHVDEKGRRWRRTDLTGPGVRKGDSGLPWRDYNPTDVGRHWQPPSYFYEKYTALTGDELAKYNLLDRLEKMDAIGLIHWTKKKGGMPTGKRLLDDAPGIPLQDLWTDIKIMHNLSSERLGYATQKPQALLERILQSSSAEGDRVLDPFCGCGTTIHAAQKLRREWIGIDITHLAISLIEKRLNDAFPGIKYEVHGTPKDLEGARALSIQDKYQFQWWAVSLVNAVPFAGKKKGADSGIDGLIYFKPDGKTTEKAIVSVKSGENVNVAMVRDLAHVVDREKAKIGVFITLAEPTGPMKTEAVKTGFYETLYGKYPRIQILTIAELFAGKQPNIPLVDPSAFKRAAREHIDEQKALPF
jgi:site-specific DNA-methyltransferase (adenine-specific)